MRSLLLVIPGHLGKDVGATASLSSDVVGSSSFSDVPNVNRMQEERWINLQQSIGFCLAYALSDLKSAIDVRLVVPNNKSLGMYENGLIKIHDFKKDYFGLEDRVKLANELGADVIEIHNNAAPFTANGFETLCFSKFNQNKEVTESYRLAENILESAKVNLGCKVRGVKPIYDYETKKYIDREIYILKNTKNNCVITEAGFLSDKSDLSKIDVDLDGYNEQVGACIWLGYQRTYKKIYTDR